MSIEQLTENRLSGVEDTEGIYLKMKNLHIWDKEESGFIETKLPLPELTDYTYRLNSLELPMNMVARNKYHCQRN